MGTTRHPHRALAAALALVALATGAACTSNPISQGGSASSSDGGSRIPLTEGDCLDGEYFDRATESCEPLEPSEVPKTMGGDAQLDVPEGPSTP